ncbi:MAG: PKD-like domain-containing protein, partial [Sediminibacterium sp.]|nr:PKD-like domain-containing protein [Sediminibacterium sp.]
MLANVFTQNIATGISVPGGDGFTNAGISTTTLANNNFLSLTVGSNSPVCSGNSLNLTSTPSGGTAPYTYKWTGPNGFSSTQQNPTITNVTTAASGTYSLEVEDGLDNSSNASISVTVNPTPTVASISGNSTGCVGSTITLSDATPGGVWSSSNTTVATVSNAGSVSVKALGSTIISYTVTTVAGCSATVTKTISTASVVLHPDLIECNNGIASFNATDTYYGVTYSNSNAGNSFFWAITGGSFSYQGSSTASSQYPRVQLLTGSSFQVVVQFTTNDITCVDTQIVYKNSIAADTIQGSHDTTVCYNTAPINLLGKVSLVTNLYNWSTSGAGTFSNPNALNTTYTPSGADKTIGVIKIYLQGSSTINSTGNCGTSTSMDSMTLRIAPDNTGTNSVQTICSNQSLNFTPVSTISGSTYSWASSVTAGSLTGNTASGTGNIIDSLVNLSSTGDAVVIYTIIPYSFTPTNNTCTGTPFTFTVTAKPKPAVTITNNATAICTGSNTNIQFSSSLTGSVYTWSSSVISGTASGNSSVAVATTTNQINDVLINNSTANATVRYHITAFSPSGCSNTDSTDVVIYALPTVANAGPDQALCDTTTAILAGNNPVSGTGNWAFLSGPSAVTFGAPSSPSGSVNGLIPGTYQLTWTISNGSCAVSKDTVVIINSAQSVAGSISANATVCAGNNNGTLTLSGYTGNIIRWESSTDGGTTWPTVINNTTSTYTYSNLTATTLFRAVVQNGACSFAYVNPVTITVNPISAPGTLTSDAIVCAGSNNSTLTLSGYTGNIIRWESSSDNGITWTNIANTTNTLTYTNLTITTLYRSLVQSGVCSSAYSNAVTITVNPQTIAGSLAADATVCATANSGTLSLSAYTGNIIRWESSSDNGTTWTNIANTTNTLTYNNLAITTLYRLLVQSGMCTSIYSNNATITVIQPVTIANAGPDQTLCYTTSASLSANTPASGTGTWTALTGNPSTVTFTNAADPATTINGLTTGTYLFVWTISNSACADSKDTVQITVNPQTVPGSIAASATVCATSNNGTLTLSGYTGSIISWESSIDNGTTWINIANTGNALTYNNLNASTQYRAYVQSGVCPPLYSSIATITVIQAVTTANAGSDQTLCYTTSASLAANTPVSGTGTWTALTGNSSTVTFTNAADPATTINGLTTGTYLFVWTISNNTCADSKDTVQLTINPQTVPGTIATSATVCATANNGTLTLSGYTGSIIRWESSIDNGTTWINIANTGNTLTYNNLATSTQYRAYVQSGVCPPLYSSIATITVIQPVTTANAGSDQTLCYTTSASLAANTPASGTGTWTALTGNPSTVTFTNAADPATTINGLTTGTYLFVWTISNSTCADSKDTVQLTINPQTVPGTIAASATVCATSNNGTLTLSGYTGSILHWESSINNGTTWNNIVNTGNTLTYNNLATSTQYRAYVQSGVCPPLYSSIATITVIQAVTIANAGPDQSLCNVASATLAANTPTSGTGTWTAFAGNPSTVSFTNIASPATTVNGLTAGTYQFLWTISNGTCSDSKDTIQITVNPATNPGTLAADATVCATSNNGTLTLSNYLSSILRWESSVDNGSSWTNVANTSNTLAYNNLSATTKYRAYVQNAVCPSLYSNIVTITVLQPVTTANAGPDTTVINGITSYKLGANTPTSGTGTWSVLPGGPSTLSFVNPSDPNTTVGGLAFNPGTPPTNGNYKLVWTVSNGYCAISRDTMQITVQPPTNPGVIGPDAVVCTSNNHGTLVLSDYLGTVLQWESSIDYGATWSVIVSTVGTNQATYTYDNLTTTTLFRALVKNGVGAELYSGIAATVTVLQLVTPADAGPDQTLCNTTSTSLAANTPVSGVGIWSALAGNPSSVTFSNSADRKSVVNGLTIGTYRFVWTISNGICSDSRDTVNITIQLPTIAGTIEADATVCITSNTGTLSISGFRGSILQGEVSIDNGSSWLAIANTANLTSYIYNNLATTSQFRAKVQNGVCPALFTNIVTITVLQEATIANAGTDQSLCNVTATTLAANTPASGTGIWTALAGNPSTTTFTNPNNPTTTVNALTAGTYQFIWTISNALCADSKDTVRITVYSPSVAGTLAAAATVCANVNTGTLTLSGYVSSIIRWESSSNNGTTWNNIANTGNTFTYNNLAATITYRAYVQNTVCPALYSNTVTINTVQPVTIANAGPDQLLCNVTAITLAANTPASGTGIWTAITGNPSTVNFTNPADPNTTVNGLTAGTYQFIWTISNALCADSKDTVRITVYSPSVAGTLAAAATVCANVNTGTLTLSGYVSSIIRWESSSNNG